MNYLITDTEIKTVADAIRTKVEAKDGMTFPDGFAAAIRSIPQVGDGQNAVCTFIPVMDDDVPRIPHGLGAIPDFICVHGDGWTETTYGERIDAIDRDGFTLHRHVAHGGKLTVIAFKSDMLRE